MQKNEASVSYVEIAAACCFIDSTIVSTMKNGHVVADIHGIIAS